MNKKNFGWIISIVLLVLLITFALVGCKKNKKKEQENEGMKVSTQEDIGESESGAFEALFPESEENKTDTDEQNEGAAGIGKDSDNVNDTSNVTEQRPPSSESPEKEDDMNNNNKDNIEEEKGQITGEEEDKDEGWGPIL